MRYISTMLQDKSWLRKACNIICLKLYHILLKKYMIKSFLYIVLFLERIYTSFLNRNILQKRVNVVIVGHQSFIKLQCEEKLCSFSALVNLSLLFQVSAVLYLREFICNNGDNLGLTSKFHFMKHQIRKNLCKKQRYVFVRGLKYIF